MPQFAARLTLNNGKTLEFHGPADITKEATEAIVNAANSYLIGGGGVDGAIHRTGGPSILKECQRIISKIGTLPAGKAVMTTAGRLPAKYVIHTVGPRYIRASKEEAEALRSCYRESLRIADEYQLASVAFPSISTGAYGYPVHEAAEIAVETVIAHLPAATHLAHVRFVLFDIATCKAYVRVAEKLARASNSAIFEKGPS